MKNLLLIIGLGFLLRSCCWLFPSTCLPVADFRCDKNTIYENETVQFVDLSYRNPIKWSWSFPDGNPASSSEQNPKVKYTSSGTYAVTLTVFNEYGLNTENKASFIIVKKQNVIGVIPESRTRLCPTWIGGDRDFGENGGPLVKAGAKLRVVNNKEIYVDIYFHLKEANPTPPPEGLTEGLGNWSFILYSVTDPGWRIHSILTSKSTDITYEDNARPPAKFNRDFPPIEEGSLVSKIEMMCDTEGNDLGTCTQDYSYLTVDFNEVKIKLIED